ncbi:unnamed protein product, partial [Prorocentrum cordatum]
AQRLTEGRQIIDGQAHVSTPVAAWGQHEAAAKRRVPCDTRQRPSPRGRPRGAHQRRQRRRRPDCPGRGRGRCCGRGVCHGQRLQQVPLPSEAGFPLHWQVQCAPGAPSPSGRTRPRLRYFSTEAASNRAAGSGRIVPPPPPP